MLEKPKTKISLINLFKKQKTNFSKFKQATKNFYTNAKSFARDILSKPTNYIMHVKVIGLSLFVSISTAYGSNTVFVPHQNQTIGKVVSQKVNPKTIAQLAKVTNAPVKINEDVLENSAPSLISSYSFSENNTIESSGSSLESGNDRQKVISYKVEDGDTVWSIAKKFNITTNTIKWANNFSDIDSIKPGQTLQILPISGTLHKVQKGEGLGKIAATYGASSAQIMEENGLLTEILEEGKVLIIPGGAKAEPRIDNKAKVADKKSSEKNKKQVKFANVSKGPDWLIRPTTGIKTQGIHDNNGVDIANASMPSVWAAAGGVVTYTGWAGAYGLTVKIKHPNGVETQYSHLNKIYVSNSQAVGQGQIIAQMGRTGRVFGRTGIHLHFEVHGARNPF